MKAVVFEKVGTPYDVLQVQEVPMPEPATGEVRVKMLSSPINPADMLFISGKYRIKPQFPQITGLEGVGMGCGVQISGVEVFRLDSRSHWTGRRRG